VPWSAAASPRARNRSVRAEVAGVGLALDPFGVEPGAEGAGGVDGELEGAQHAGGAGGAVLPLRFRRQLQEGLAGQGHHPPAERHVLGDLGVDGGPAALGGVVFEPAEQHGLAHSAQPGEDHRAFGTAAFQPAEQDVEAVELLVAAHEQRWAGARVGRIRVLPRVHGHLPHELPRTLTGWPCKSVQAGKVGAALGCPISGATGWDAASPVEGAPGQTRAPVTAKQRVQRRVPPDVSQSPCRKRPLCLRLAFFAVGRDYADRSATLIPHGQGKSDSHGGASGRGDGSRKRLTAPPRAFPS